VDANGIVTAGGLTGASDFPVTQGAFLHALGIEARAQRLKARADGAQAAAIDAALTRLTGEAAGQMGALFKAMAKKLAWLSARQNVLAANVANAKMKPVTSFTPEKNCVVRMVASNP